MRESVYDSLLKTSVFTSVCIINVCFYYTLSGGKFQINFFTIFFKKGIDKSKDL